MKAEGRCLCGGVGFSTGLPSKWVAHCHCQMCRRTHGAAFITWVGVDEACVDINDAQGLLEWYSSSEHAQRGFCRRCGSSMFFKSTRWPGELHITLANFSDPVDRQPQAHAYYDSHVEWFTVNDRLPKRSDNDA